MKYGYFGFGMLLFGSVGLVIIVMMQSITINNDSEYYNLKEAMEASMLESIDMNCYRNDTLSEKCKYTLKIVEQKFVENFTKRFVATVGGDANNYTLEFYDIIESPPKASVVIRGKTSSYGTVSQGEGLNITNSLTGILQLRSYLRKDLFSDLVVEEENSIDYSTINLNPDVGNVDLKIVDKADVASDGVQSTSNCNDCKDTSDVSMSELPEDDEETEDIVPVDEETSVEDGTS